MNSRTHSQEADQVRSDILDAAEQRLRTYGYGKTTMAEIATDVGMSAANLYRYFDSKLEIGAALTQRCFSERYAVLQNVVEKKNINAREKLEAFVIAALRYSHAEFSETPKINELVDIIVAERSDLIQTKIENDHKLIRIILESGIQSDEFAIDDIETTAQSVQHAIVKFNVPLFMALYPLKEFEEHARNLVQLLIRGLNAR